jgi:hypothetical protein
MRLAFSFSAKNTGAGRHGFFLAHRFEKRARDGGM